MKKRAWRACGTAACVALTCTSSYAFTFKTGMGDLEGALDSNVTAGLALRTQNPSCSLTGDPNTNNCGGGANTAQWANGDDGDLNYKKYKPYTTYLSLTSELLMSSPSLGLKFMARGTGLYDFMAKNTQRTDLSADAYSQVVHNFTLLDLWAQKSFNIADQQARIRIGNQAINWGESYFASGGINATNALDIQKLLIPGTQLKQALLPAPMVNFATSLPGGFSTEMYWQWKWNANRYPPVGTYWSTGDVFGKGFEPATLNTNNFNVGGLDAGTIAGPGRVGIGQLNATNASLVNGAFASSAGAIGVPYFTTGAGNKPQYGIRMGYRPPGVDVNFGLYYLQYTDKAPVATYRADGSSEYHYLSDRRLFGASANFPVADWAIGTELSYRPRDAVSMSGCFGAGGPADANTNGASGGDCQAWKDFKKFQFDINAQLNLTPSTYPFIKLLHADAAVFTAEFTWIKYPGVNPDAQYYSTMNGKPVYQMVDAGYVTWLNNNSGLGYPIAAGGGTSNSMGITLDFNWTYDGSLIPGWQVTPGITFSGSLHGYTPTFSYNYAQGAKSVNLYVLFNQNPTVWQAGINYAMFFGGNATSQVYGDRNFVGLFVTRNF